jgi:hypothetical protein
MTDKELRKLGRQELVELLETQGKSYDLAKLRLEELEQENRSLREALITIRKSVEDLRTREETAVAMLAEKESALRGMEMELSGVRAQQAARAGLEERVDGLVLRFRQLRELLKEKDESLFAAERKIAEQEQTIRSLRGDA